MLKAKKVFDDKTVDKMKRPELVSTLSKMIEMEDIDNSDMVWSRKGNLFEEELIGGIQAQQS